MKIIAIDPGAIHCGVAEFVDGRCWRVAEYDPDGLFEYLDMMMSSASEDVELVVVESFRLYPGKAAAQAWSKMGTVEVIGVIRFLTTQHEVELLEQGAWVKKIARVRMKAQGVDNLAVTQRMGRHCADAVEHGWYFLKGQG